MIIGLPALRLSGLYLALITLMAAAAISIVLQQTNFPNGGGGFLGYSDHRLGTPALRRPAVAGDDDRVLPLHAGRRRADVPARPLHVRGKPGRAWAAIRQSQPAALAAG